MDSNAKCNRSILRTGKFHIFFIGRTNESTEVEGCVEASFGLRYA